jgi:predicted outer membrane protein
MAKTIRFLLLGAACAFAVLATASLAQQAPESGEHLTRRDAAFLQELRRAHATSVAAGGVLLTRARVPAVQKAAQLMVDTHAKLLEEADRLAKFKHLDAPSPVEAAPQELRDAPDDAVDRAYLAWAVASGMAALDLAERAAAEAHDPNVKALATKVAAHLKTQLGIYRELAAALGPA